MRLPSLRKLFRRALIAALAMLCAFIIGVIVFLIRCNGPVAPPKEITTAAIERHKITADIKDYARPEEDTYWTYPEWYIVWSYQEKADHQEHNLPSGFPYFGAIRQYWSGYCCMYRFTRGRYPFNFGDHVMLAVIGTSFSFEYAIKGFYEKTIGRLTEWIAGNDPTGEDRYAYATARAYADFVHIRPFYEFSFRKRFKGLWSENSLWGSHPVRKWERRIFLSLDYGIEAFYCWLIEAATHASYGVEPADTYVWIENAPADLFAREPHIRKVRQVGTGAYIATIPRYQEFTDVARRLARAGVQFVEVAGNDEIAITVLAPNAWSPPKGAQLLFANPLPTRSDVSRFALHCPVASLHQVLNALGENIEHVYDY
jgi:hypothetical protein